MTSGFFRPYQPIQERVQPNEESFKEWFKCRKKRIKSPRWTLDFMRRSIRNLTNFKMKNLESFILSQIPIKFKQVRKFYHILRPSIIPPGLVCLTIFSTCRSVIPWSIPYHKSGFQLPSILFRGTFMVFEITR